MTIEVGDTAPDFTLPDAAGAPVTLSGLLRHGPVVLAFYPEASSEVCTVQFGRIAGDEDRFARDGARVVGVSGDHPPALARFAHDIGLRRTLLLSDADPKGAVARAYGVWIDGYEVAGRATFIIDRDRVVRGRETTPTPLELPDQERYFTALAACRR